MSARTIRVTADPLMRPVSAYTAPGELHAEGICIAVCDAPTLTIETKSGERVHWRADLCKVDGEVVTEAGLQAFRSGRPQVVSIDVEDHEQLRRIWDAYDGPAHRWPEFVAAFASLLPPPRPEEPTGLGAVVEDDEGRRYVHAPDGPRDRSPWACGDEEAGGFYAWSDIPAPVRVLSTGVKEVAGDE